MAESRSKNIRHEQYYAVSNDGELLHIDDTHADMEEVYCIYCHCKMLRKRGDERKHHYAHDYRSLRDKDIKCSYDLYLQAYAKKRLLKWYENAPDINIHYERRILCPKIKDCVWCKGDDFCAEIKEDVFDIKKILPKLEYKRLQQSSSLSSVSHYILVSNKKDNEILIVVKACEINDFEEKDEPKQRTIEIRIDSEDDVNKIVESHDLYENENIIFRGFNPKDTYGHDIPVRRIKLSKFSLNSNGEVYVRQDYDCAVCGISTPNVIFDITFEQTYGITVSKLINWGMVITSENFCKQRFCALCKNRYWDWNNRVLCCQKSGEILKLNQNGNSCPNYNADTEYIHRKKEEYDYFKRNHTVIVWDRNEQ